MLLIVLRIFSSKYLWHSNFYKTVNKLKFKTDQKSNIFYNVCKLLLFSQFFFHINYMYAVLNYQNTKKSKQNSHDTVKN